MPESLFLSPDDVRYHLSKYGFLPNYYVWNCHGEKELEITSSQNDSEDSDMEPTMDYHTMVMDAAGLQFELCLRHLDFLCFGCVGGIKC
ncbi:hypothetical protein ACS0TY_030057 [Phlomoides rotata]